MRIKVEIEWKGVPWRKCNQIQKLSVVDAVVGVLVAVVYIVKLSCPDLEPEFPGLTDTDRLNNSLALVFLVAANFIQTMHASRLCFVVSKKEGRDPKTCFEAAKTWYDFTSFGYTFMTVKCFITVSYIIKVAPHPWVLVLAALTIPEVIFKLHMLYVVYGFMNDLKESVKFLPKFRFIPVIDDIESNYDYRLDEKFQQDFNANTKLMPPAWT